MTKNWDHVRSRIHDLYIIQRRSLDEVRSIMSDQHRFYAASRTYRIKFKEWGYKKRRGGMQREIRSGVQRSQSTVDVTSFSGHDQHNMTTHFLPSLDLLPYLAPEHVPTMGNTQPWPLPVPTSYPPQSVRNDQQNLYAPVQGSPTYHFPIKVPVFQPGQTGEDVNKQDDDGRTRLHHSAMKGSVQEVDDLISSGATIDIQDFQGKQPVHYAASRAAEGVLRLLLKRGADINAKGPSGRTPLHLSVRHLKTLKLLLQLGPLISAQDNQGETPLHQALSLSSTDAPPRASTIGKLIQHGADVNIHSQIGITPFHMILEKKWLAAKHGASFVVMFLENGALVSSKTADGKLPFEVFLENSNFKWAEYQHPSGRVPDTKRNLDIKQFIAKGADPNTRLKSGETLLNEALRRRILDLGKDRDLGLLLCNSADINKSGLYGDYPLQHVLRCTFPQIDTVKDFLCRGADPNHSPENGQSPLMALLCNANYTVEEVLDMIALLIQNGAYPMQRNSKNQRPIYLVARKYNNHHNLAKLLKSFLEAKGPDVTQPRAIWSDESRHLDRDQDWWDMYRSLYQSCSWSSPADLTTSSQSLPADVSELISKTALNLLAEKFLSPTAASFKNLKETQGLQCHDTKNACNQIVIILRDCRDLKIDVDQKWYHLLLEDVQLRDFSVGTFR